MLDCIEAITGGIKFDIFGTGIQRESSFTNKISQGQRSKKGFCIGTVENEVMFPSGGTLDGNLGINRNTEKSLSLESR